MPGFNPIICAVDTVDVSAALRLTQEISGSVGAIKLGLEFFTANGAGGVAALAKQQLPLFLDLKFHDIPNTVASAIRATQGMDCFMMTVHTSGGADMMKAAADAAKDVAARTGKKRPLIVGVTVLTSMDQKDIEQVGIAGALDAHVARLAELAQSSGLDGVVCSPHEIVALRASCGKDFTLVVPGIRPDGSDQGDQKRKLTPAEALKRGASYLVIGRPITQSISPKAAAQAIVESVQ